MHIKDDAVLEPHLEKQVDYFIDLLRSYNAILPPARQREEKDYLFQKDFYKQFLLDRNTRAADVKTPTYSDIASLARSQFPVRSFWNLCMDGRVKTVLTNGVTAKVGSSIRVPGGILREFVRNENGKIVLLRESNFANVLDNTLERSDTIAEIFDSHIACAARKAEEESKGKDLEDTGLLRDVLHKQEMLIAIAEYLKEKYGQEKKILAIQISFDPHDGFMYMGLETEKAIAYAKEVAEKIESDGYEGYQWQYTDAVLQNLVKEGSIIHTKALIQDESIQKILKAHAFMPDWQHDYRHSAAHFWQGIVACKEALSSILTEKLTRIYPQLKHEKNSIELEERIILLLTNLFSGFLLNQTGHYPYSEHREECVKVSPGGFPPYDISAFVVLSSDEKNLVSTIQLAVSLVRSNRKAQRVHDRSGLFSSPTAFSQAPVPIILQSIVREPLTDHEWDAMAHIDWSDLPKDWEKLSDVAFLRYLQKKGEVHVAAALAINDLRRRMRILFDADHVTSERLISQHITALPTVMDSQRKTHFIVPFIKLGFSS